MITTYKIALLDDHRVVLESFATLLATNAHFDVVGMAHNEHSLLTILDQTPVDILVTDLIMPSLNVTELIPMLKTRHPDLHILVLSGGGDAESVRAVMRAGANGFVTKTADKTELYDAILAVASGRGYVDSRVYATEEIRPSLSEITPLTTRETEVASLILDELSSNQIADRLFISFNTVETHRKRIYHKLGVTTSLGLMKSVLKYGFLN